MIEPALIFQDAATTPLGGRVRAASGLCLLVALAWGLSTHRRQVSWRLVVWGIGLQIAFALVVLRTPVGVAFFDWMNGLVNAVLGYAEVGGRFVFGNLVSDNVPVGTLDPGRGFTASPGVVARTGAFFAFRIFPNIIFVASLMTVLYHLGVMQRVVRGVGGHRAHQRAAPVVPFPHQRRIPLESLGRGQIFGAVAGPESGLGIAKGGHAALGGYPGSGERHHALGAPQRSGKF